MDAVASAYRARIDAGGLQPDGGQSALVPKLDALASALSASRTRPGLRGLFAKPPPAPRGLYIWGGVGRGKSMLMDLFFAVADAPKRRVHFHAFMQEVQAGIARARKAGAEDAIRPVAEAVAGEVRLLCFDEMQVTDIADAMIIGRLFELLFVAGVTVVTTSNRPPEDLYKDGLNRALFLPFIDLLRDRMEVVHLDSPTDHRRRVFDGAPVWFVPADRAAAARIEKVWQGLTGGEPAAPLTLTVSGRAVVLPQARSGVARATFWDLCAKPLGPADYLAIAGAVRVLILEDIPVLSSANYNEAKRFVTLIDALYEAHVRLIASAADEPERLYIEGAGAFEFERTASRLREMMGAAWGQGG
jgi:cell division protein ZapE